MCISCDHDNYLEQIDDMLSDERFDFASDTLEGIRDWVAEKLHITEKQKEAVDNILASVTGRE